MWKTLGIAAAGIFVGAFAVEVVRRLNPGFLEKVEQSAKDTKEAVVGAFKEGLSGEEAGEEVAE